MRKGLKSHDTEGVQDLYTVVIEERANRVLMVLDLDNTLVDTEALLKQRGLIPQDKQLYANHIDDVVDAYMILGEDLLYAKPFELVASIGRDAVARGVSVVVITSRLSIPIEITKKQVSQVLGEDVPVFVSDKKWATVNSLVRNGGYSSVIIVDDKFDGYSGLNVPTVVYLHPKSFVVN